MWECNFVVWSQRLVKAETLGTWKEIVDSPSLIVIDDRVVFEHCADEIDYSKNHPYRFGKMWYRPDWLEVERTLQCLKEGD